MRTRTFHPKARGPATLLPARFTASSVSSDGIDAEVTIVAKLGDPLVENAGKDWDRIGNAVHAYLGLQLTASPDGSKHWAAERLLKRWDAVGLLSSAMLIEVGSRWTEWIDTAFPGAEMITQSPIAWRNDGAQVMEGWIDARIELPIGEHNLVDHKEYPVKHIRERYLGQLSVYCKALNMREESVPMYLFIRLPLLGFVAELHLSVDQLLTQ